MDNDEFRVLLIDPPAPATGLHTGLGYLAGSLSHAGYEVKVLDLVNMNHEVGAWGVQGNRIDFQEAVKQVRGMVSCFKPGLIGVSVKTATAVSSQALVGIVKQMLPDVPIVIGGPHVTLEGEEYLFESGADYGVAGEGEGLIVDMCKSELDRRYPGFLFDAGLIPELDGLPYPDYGCFTSVIANGNRIVNYPLLTSRGCVYNCSFCSSPQIWQRKWRPRSPEKVVDELLQAKEKHGISAFTVMDDNFSFDLSRAKFFCELLVAEGVKLPWKCSTGVRADRLDRELLQKMKEAGCEEISIGVETVDPEVFKHIGKGETVDQIMDAIQLAKQTGIDVTAYVIIGLPYSTLKSDQKTLAFMKREKLKAVWFSMAPYPHTPAWEYVRKHGRLLQGHDGDSRQIKLEPFFETPEYPKREREYMMSLVQHRQPTFRGLARNLIDRFLGDRKRGDLWI